MNSSLEVGFVEWSPHMVQPWGTMRKAVDYALHVELGGLAGIIAPVIGKQPADYRSSLLNLGDGPFSRYELP